MRKQRVQRWQNDAEGKREMATETKRKRKGKSEH